MKRFFLAIIVVLIFLLFPIEVKAQTFSCMWDQQEDICVPSRADPECDNEIPVSLCGEASSFGECTSMQNLPCFEEIPNEPGQPNGPCEPGLGVGCPAGYQCINQICRLPEASQPVNTAEQVRGSCPEKHISTAIGCINFEDINQTASFFLSWGLGIAGGVALLLIGFAGYQIATSQGNPQRLQGGQELLLSAIGGLLMIILSVYLLRFIGIDLLKIF